MAWQYILLKTVEQSNNFDLSLTCWDYKNLSLRDYKTIEKVRFEIIAFIWRLLDTQFYPECFSKYLWYISKRIFIFHYVSFLWFHYLMFRNLCLILFFEFFKREITIFVSILSSLIWVLTRYTDTNHLFTRIISYLIWIFDSFFFQTKTENTAWTFVWYYYLDLFLFSLTKKYSANKTLQCLFSHVQL